MSSMVEQRLYRLEQQLALAQNQIASLQSLVAQLRQQQWTPGGGTGGGGGSGIVSYFVMAPSSGTIQGTWSGAAMTAAGSFTGTAYQLSNGTITSMGTQSAYNGLPAALANSKACVCVPDGAGNYVVVSQSCT